MRYGSYKLIKRVRQLGVFQSSAKTAHPEEKIMLFHEVGFCKTTASSHPSHRIQTVRNDGFFFIYQAVHVAHNGPYIKPRNIPNKEQYLNDIVSIEAIFAALRSVVILYTEKKRLLPPFCTAKFVILSLRNSYIMRHNFAIF